MIRKITSKPISIISIVFVLILAFAGCTDMISSNINNSPGSGATVSLTVTLPESTRAQAKGFDIIAIHITAMHATLDDVTAELTYDATTSSWSGAVENLAEGDWTFYAEAVDDTTPAAVVLFSGYSDTVTISAATPNTVAIQLFEHSGVVSVAATWTDAGTVDAVRVTANRTNFTPVVTVVDVFPDETSATVYSSNLANGDWEIVVEGLYKGVAYSSVTEPVVTVASVAYVTAPLVQTGVTPVIFSVDPNIPQITDFDLELTCATDDVVIYYTDDESDPTSSGTVVLYSAPFAILPDATIRAYATKSGFDPSPETSGVFTFAKGQAGKFSAGNYHAAMIRSDGTLWTWGENADGQLGLGDYVGRDVPTQVGTDNDWIKVSAGYEHTLALKNDGSLWGWGDNTYGQLGNGTTASSNVPVQVAPGLAWIDIAAGSRHSLGVTSDFRLYGWGTQYYGELGNGAGSSNNYAPAEYSTTPQTGWEKVYASFEYSSMAIKTDGTLYAFGDSNYYGTLGLGNTNDQWSPMQVGTATWKSVSLSYHHTAGIQTDNSLWTWGSNANGQLGINSTTSYSTPQQVTGTWAAVAVSYDHTIAVDNTGLLWVWGDGDSLNGSLGTYTSDQLVPAQIGADADWVDVQATNGYGNSANIVLKTDGSLWSFGWNNEGQLGDGQGFDTHRYAPSRIGTAANWAMIDAGNDHSVALTTTGEIWAWGDNYDGQLGVGDTTDRFAPTRVGTDSDWMMIAVGGDDFTAALKTGGTLYTWGCSANGQLANSSSADVLSPQPVASPAGATWSSIATGYASLFAIRSDAGYEGELWASGWNYYGALGTGDGTDRYILTRITTDTDWKMVSGGYQHTAAVKTDGTLWVWGYNSSKQLGEATTATNSYVPIQLGTDTDWDNVYAGENYTLAQKTDGTLWAWGTGYYGAHGLGTTASYVTTRRVGAETGWQLVSACDASTYEHTIGIRDNRLYAWGRNDFGELGTGSDVVNGADETLYAITLIDPSPVWTAVSTGRGHSLGIQTDGSLWAWGYNGSGQIAVTCYNNSYSSPIQLEPVRVAFP